MSANPFTRKAGADEARSPQRRDERMATPFHFEKTLRFKLDRETPGALLYREILPNGRLAQAPNAPGAVVGVLYVRKSATNGQYPDMLETHIVGTIPLSTT